MDDKKEVDSDTEKEVNSDTENKGLTKEQERKLIFFGAIGFIVLMVVGGIYQVIYPPPPSTLEETTKNHFPVIVGLPVSAVLAYVLVKTLKQGAGVLEFSVWKITFKGASGEVVLWLLCFLGIVGAIKLLW